MSSEVLDEAKKSEALKIFLRRVCSLYVYMRKFQTCDKYKYTVIFL